MDDQSNDSKLDKIQEDIGEIKVHLAEYNVLLDVHIKRSNMLEEKMIPIEKHVAMVDGALKLIGLLAAIAAIVEAVFVLIK